MTTEATVYHEFLNYKQVSLSSKMFRSTTRSFSWKAFKALTEGTLTYKQIDYEYKIH